MGNFFLNFTKIMPSDYLDLLEELMIPTGGSTNGAELISPVIITVT
jgi:hypothetical protein